MRASHSESALYKAKGYCIVTMEKVIEDGQLKFYKDQLLFAGTSFYH